MNRHAIEQVLRTLHSEQVGPVHGLIWAGSSRSVEVTSHSDVDVVLIYHGLPRSYRKLRQVGDILLEILAHTPSTIAKHFSREVTNRRPGLLHMCAMGELMFATDEIGASVQQNARQVLAAGPAPLAAAEHDFWRYRLTVEADDLAECYDPAVRAMLGGTLLSNCLEFLLLGQGAWAGSPKWMIQDLDACAPDRAAQARAAASLLLADDVTALLELVYDVLAASGGRCGDGYTRFSSLA